MKLLTLDTLLYEAKRMLPEAYDVSVRVAEARTVGFWRLQAKANGDTAFQDFFETEIALAAKIVAGRLKIRWCP